MSKYNHIKSIPVDSIPKEEMATAIKEWAEGNDSLEKLLTACYENGIKTNGSHGDGSPFFSWNYYTDSDTKNKTLKILSAALNFKNTQMFVNPDGGNPFSGDEWYLPFVNVGMTSSTREESYTYCDSLTEALNSDKLIYPENVELYKKFLNLLDFFLDKESGLLFRIKHEHDGEYIFSIESPPAKEIIELYYNQLFTDAGLVKKTNPDVPERLYWKKRSYDLEEFKNDVIKAIDIIINNYSLEPATSEDEITNFQLLARFKKKEFGDSLEGKEKMTEWLRIEKEKRDRRWKKMGLIK